MAVYEYYCPSCDQKYDKVRAIFEPEPEYDCYECNGTLVRVWNTFGIKFNGGGFYVNDSRF